MQKKKYYLPVFKDQTSHFPVFCVLQSIAVEHERHTERNQGQTAGDGDGPTCWVQVSVRVTCVVRAHVVCVCVCVQGEHMV